ncbi:MAG: helix-turn-helix domain-containing protein [Deltaproteobacteria bacterium]|nr:helix-turn-helix domain-containing protein [Deltaproteobacteria bacterium]
MGRDPVTVPSELARTLAEIEKEHVQRVVEACSGNLAAAARVLGIDRSTLVRKLRRWGVSQER